MRRKIVAGNWKMNKTFQEGMQLVDEIIQTTASATGNDVLKIIAPPFIHLSAVYEKLKSINNFEVAAQNCHQNPSGAYTGEISAEMIASTGAKYVIIGHSERRQYYNETNDLLAKKITASIENKLIPIFCLGENIDERNANQHLEVVKQQLRESLFHLSPSEFSNVIIAYEPVWAIGTGATATCHQAQGMHHYIRTEVNKKFGKDISENISILYGGSCNPQNAKELFSCMDVDGGLIGGASLKAADYNAIVNSF